MTTPPIDSVDTAPGSRPPETVDRLMVGACGAIWLVFLVVASIAGVALVNLGRGGGRGGEDSSWLLYTVIAVSAAVIVGAIPLLLRARRASMESAPAPAEAPVDPPAAARAVDAPTEKIRVFGTSVDPLRKTPEPAPVSRLHVVVERIWLRGAMSLLGAMGLALTAVATASYLLSVYSDTAAWVALGVAAVLTAAMPAILVAFQRRLARASDKAADAALA